MTEIRENAAPSVQNLITALVHSVCDYNPLCNPINIPKYLFFNKRVHATYRKLTKRIISQPSHAILSNRQHHGLHIFSFQDDQLKSHTHELNVRIDSTDTTQHAQPRVRFAYLEHNHTRTPNLINDTILSLSQYDFYLRDPN